MKTLHGRRLGVFGIIAVVALLAASCATTHNITVDKEAPKEQNAVVRFGDGIWVNLFNGEDVHKKWYGGLLSSYRFVKLTVPAGKAEVEYYLSYSTGGTYYTYTYRARDLVLVYTFEAGKKYDLTFDSRRKDGKLERGIALYDKLPAPIVGHASHTPIEFWVLNFE